MSYKGIPNEEATSKFPKKLSRDIYLSNDIGRDTNVDPFVQQDITKLFGDKRKLDRSQTILSFATKPPVRHTPSPIDMRRSTGRHNGLGNPFPSKKGGEGEGTLYSTTTSALGASDVRLERSGSDGIGFTKDSRWSDDRPQNASQMRKEVAEKRRLMQIEVELQRARVSLDPPPIISPPDPSRAPDFAGYSKRNGASALAAGTGSGLSAPLERFTRLPWEKKAHMAKKSVELAIPAGAVAAGHHSGATARSVGFATSGGRPPTHRSAHTTSDGFQDEEEERWNNERKLLIQRMGLGAGGSHSRREYKKKQPHIRGADFGSVVSRKAPLLYHQPNVEVHDLMYNPSIASTTRARVHSADVRLNRYSSRETSASAKKPYLDTADNILQFENLMRFHDTQKKRAKESVFALPDQDDDDEDDNSGTTRTNKRGGESDDHATLSKRDDFNLHPESVLPPQRGVFSAHVAHSPSLFFYADRPGSSVASILGGVRQTVGASLQQRKTRPGTAPEAETSGKLQHMKESTTSAANHTISNMGP